MKKCDFNVAIIGGGVIGLAIAYNLSKYLKDIVLLESNEQLGQEISSRNSEVIHSGIYYKNPSLKLFHCLRGNQLLYAYCQLHNIPFKKTGKLIVAGKNSLNQLEDLFKNAKNNKVNELDYLDRAQVSKLEPELNVHAAIYSGTTGIIDSHEFIQSLANNFQNNGGIIMTKTEFIKADFNYDQVKVVIGNPDNTEYNFSTSSLINASGLSSTENLKRINGHDEKQIPETTPFKGNYFYYSSRNPFSHLIYPIPDKHGLGIHVTIDMDNKLKFGPDVDLSDTHLEVNEHKKDIFFKKIREYWPNVEYEKLKPDYVGLRPKIFFDGEMYHDYYIHDQIKDSARLISLFGIESPGLTSSLSIAKEISSRMNNGSMHTKKI